MTYSNELWGKKRNPSVKFPSDPKFQIALKKNRKLFFTRKRISTLEKECQPRKKKLIAER
jgi:hypothetical protein